MVYVSQVLKFVRQVNRKDFSSPWFMRGSQVLKFVRQVNRKDSSSLWFMHHKC